MRHQSLQDWLDWQQTLHPKSIDLSLDRMRRVASLLGVDQHALSNQTLCPKIITVGGTNGKGSCVRTLESLLLAQDIGVGSFTSPHLQRYNERIRVNGCDASDEAIVGAFAAIDKARGDISLTYFEFSTLAAAWLFAQAGVEVWLLEVGLGGRLDSVNIWSADVAVITSIGLDHMDYLGDTREAIGREKAGIFRPDRWAVVAEPDLPDSVIDCADQAQCKLVRVDRDFTHLATKDLHGNRWRWQGTLCVDGKTQVIDRVLSRPNIPEASAAAALTALACLDLLPEQPVCASVFSSLGLAGRFQPLSYRGAPMRLDVAHNPDAARLLADRLASIERDYAGVVAIVAMMSDKDIAGTLAPLRSVVSRWYLPPLPSVPRAASPQQLAGALQTDPQRIEQVDTMAVALSRAAEENPNHLIVVFGSFYTAEACLNEAGVESNL